MTDIWVMHGGWGVADVLVADPAETDNITASQGFPHVRIFEGKSPCETNSEITLPWSSSYTADKVSLSRCCLEISPSFWWSMDTMLHQGLTHSAVT